MHTARAAVAFALLAYFLSAGCAPLAAQNNYEPASGGVYGSYPSYPSYPSAPPGNAYGQNPNARLPVAAYGNSSAPSQPGREANSARVVSWFKGYDQIRRQAQMSPDERQRADYLLSRGMSILMPGPEKLAARDILTRLVNKYQIATNAMRQLPLIPETAELHRGYYQYFNNARLLFTDYLRVQDNVFVTDASTGQPLASQLIQRKQALEQLNQRIQALDSHLRAQNRIPAYRY